MRFKNFTGTDEDKNQNEMVDELNTGLTRLSFNDNFESDLSESITIAATTEVEVKHSLKSIPSYYLIVRQTGDARIIDGDTAWTNDKIYLKNTSGTDAVVSLLIFK
jgi:hypothetical protein